MWPSSGRGSAINRCAIGTRAVHIARMAVRSRPEPRVLKRKNPQIAEIYGFFPNSGGAKEDRTPDLVIANDALSQLSYGPTAGFQCSAARRACQAPGRDGGRR